MPHKHRKQRRRRIREFIRKSIMLGDKRSPSEIGAHRERADEEIDRAFDEAFRDGEIKEVVVNRGCHYPAADLHEGEVLHLGPSGILYTHPMLMRQ